MALTTHEQAMALLRASEHTLICFPEQVGGDGVATSLALAIALESMRPGHQIDVVSSGFEASHRNQYRFLPAIDRIAKCATPRQKVRIRIPLRNPEASDIKTAIVNGAMEIELEHHDASLEREHIATAIERKAYDTIIVVDCSDLNSLGALYTEHASLFQTTPIIAIDHAPEHERFGQIHCIDVTAAACGEVAAACLIAIAPEAITPDVATCLLTAILAKTRSFRSPRLSSRTFTIVSDLLECGARREEVAAALFQTKSISQLHLWGRALTRLRTDREHKLAWTILSQHDFLASGASMESLPDIVDELLANSPEAELICIICEQPDRTIAVNVSAPSGRHDAAALLRPLNGIGGALRARAILPAQQLVEAEHHILNVIRQRVRQR
ncbi:MAG: hypothetical protein ABIG71_02365 [Candidatus Uhrbacteria bacterium]